MHSLCIPQNSEILNRIISSQQVLEIFPKIHIFAMWLLVYECDFLFRHKLYFEPNILFEDILFATYAFSKTQKAMFIDKPLYHYRTSRKGSIMDTNDKNLHKVASSHFSLAKNFYHHSTLAQSKANKAFLLHWSIFYVKETLRDIQKTGYAKELTFNKNDIRFFMPLLPIKYRFCGFFPRIYGFPKLCRLAMLDIIKSRKIPLFNNKA